MKFGFVAAFKAQSNFPSDFNSHRKSASRSSCCLPADAEHVVEDVLRMQTNNPLGPDGTEKSSTRCLFMTGALTLHALGRDGETRSLELRRARASVKSL